MSTDAIAAPVQGGLTVVSHPLVRHKVTLLRDVETRSGEFRRLCREVTLLAAYEALSDLPLATTTVRTPITTTESEVLAGPDLAVVGILRAGLIMVDAILDLVPQARVGHLGLFRNPETHLPEEYYAKLPEGIADREVLVVDPMLATGGSAVHALDVLARAGVKRPRLLSIIACPEGVERVRSAHPHVPVIVAALDEGLNDHKYIVPGLGDAGDRIYGTR